MIKFTIFLLLTTLSLFAGEATDDQLQDIYTEALLFVGIFGAMGIISFIYSSRHANSYTPSQEEQGRIAKEKEKRERKEKRVEELSKVLNDKAITQEEFDILRAHYNQ